mmetsp:Transcript_68012/g.141826  ORF Transcript_68012/g.141826 Transcript_68012/m.141826 type:complete len:252 (+) Transcript_68012:1620-2375(+)
MLFRPRSSVLNVVLFPRPLESWVHPSGPSPLPRSERDIKELFPDKARFIASETLAPTRLRVLPARIPRSSSVIEAFERRESKIEIPPSIPMSLERRSRVIRPLFLDNISAIAFPPWSFRAFPERSRALKKTGLSTNIAATAAPASGPKPPSRRHNLPSDEFPRIIWMNRSSLSSVGLNCKSMHFAEKTRRRPLSREDATWSPPPEDVALPGKEVPSASLLNALSVLETSFLGDTLRVGEWLALCDGTNVVL